jgi:hypothetical protein
LPCHVCALVIVIELVTVVLLHCFCSPHVLIPQLFSFTVHMGSGRA